MIDIEKDLNESQRQAVTMTEGPLLVIAGAGSGKTRVIEYRVVHLVQKGVLPQSILLLTFTRKAAQQMLDRASARDPRCMRVEGGTFHSFAYRLLKKYSRFAGFDTFSIIDEDDAQSAINICTGKLGISTDKERKFPRKDTLRKIISMSINKALPIETILEAEYPNYADYCGEIERISDEFTAYKKEKGYLDYDDLLVYCRTLLNTREEIREALNRKYRYIMVDEYQDINVIQADITCLLGAAHNNVMAVGDDAQSIYGFRGASHRNIMEFPKRFPGARIVKLEANYRSSQAILDVANAALKNMRNKFAKDLFSAAKNRGSKPKLLCFQDNSMEAEWVAEKILFLRDSGFELGKQAVLFRSAHISIPLQMELSRRNIPFAVFGGMKFYETGHVKDIVAHLKILLNPRDELSWNRVLTMMQGVGPKTASRLIDRIAHTAADGALISDTVLHENSRAKFYQHLSKLAGLYRFIGDKSSSLEQKYSKIFDYYYPVMQDKFDDWNQRANDLEALRNIISKYDSLQDFLAEFALDPPDNAGRGGGRLPEGGQPLTLSTIHSAKGLEWDCVFLLGLIEGVLPVSFALNDDDRIEEEQRLFYVALTRAKQHLFLSVHQEGMSMGMTGCNKISRFLDSPEILAHIDQDIQMDYDPF